jgi:D-aspartate ligase
MPRRTDGVAVVAEVGWVNGLAAVRSLGRRGLRVVAIDHRPWALGFRSRYAEPALAPEPVDDEDAFVHCLVELAEGFDAPAPIFPTHDEHANAIARNADALRDAYRFPFPSWDVLGRVQRKRHQVETAEAIGFPVPRTRYPTTAAEAKEAGDELGYPVFVKPSHPIPFKRRFRRQAFRCERWPELEAAFESMREFEPMIQEFVPGGDDQLYTLGSYVAEDGTPLALFCGRKLRQTREWMGSCRVGESLWVDEVVENGLELLRALGFHGISQVEVKRDPRDGRYKLIEINPRLWQWHGLAAACGVDVPWIAYCDLMGRRPAPARMRVEGKRWAITFMAGSTRALQRPPYVDGVIALDDPLPALTQLARAATRFGERARLRIPVTRPSPTRS